jgi:hypothetical protein
MNREPQFFPEERLRIYHHALTNLIKDGEQFPKAICGLIQLAVMKFIPVDHSWHYEMEWDFPELWALRPEGAEEHSTTGRIWWPFDATGYQDRVKALRNAIENVKKFL